MRLILFILLFAGLTASAVASPEMATSITRHAGPYKPSLIAFYKSQPIWWSKAGHQTSDAKQVERILADTVWQGLNPDNYKVKAIAAAREAKDWTSYDVLMTTAVIQYIRDVTAPRIAPSRLKLVGKFWNTAPSADLILATLLKRKDASDLMEDVTPKGKTYKLLQKKLKDMAAQVARSEALPSVPYMQRLQVGDASPMVPALRARLDVPNNQAPALYDDKLARAVQLFQKEHGLTPDGIVGVRTVRMMNMTPRQRMDQVIANLEWMRWIEAQAKTGKVLIVNIPAMRLWAIEDGKVAAEMSVVVGRPDRPTPVFATTVTGVRLNPTWTMPMTIKREDYLPKLKENPFSLENKNITIHQTTATGEVIAVSPENVDWQDVDEEALKTYRFVQKSGANNALGQIRLLMPNPYDVYLHDTNAPEMFGRDGRMQSSGCVRMQEPAVIAEFILRDNPGWVKDSLATLIASGKMRDVPATNRVPVYLLYQTIWPGEGGQLVMGDDIYDLDQRLIQALKTSGKYPSL
ncbi:MAG: L,D-transpeptidase family protein [Pseudomonadota bacterium]